MTRTGDVLIGRKGNGEKVYVEVQLQSTGDTRKAWPRTDHKGTVTNPDRLTITGAIVSKYGSVQNSNAWVTCGQTRDDLLQIERLAVGWTVADVVKLHEIWENFHLNDMQPGCDHQPRESWVYEDTNYGRQINLDATPRCPETGYKFGSQWLYKAVPVNVIEWLGERFAPHWSD